MDKWGPGVSISSNSGPSPHKRPFCFVVSSVHDVGSSLTSKTSLPSRTLPRELLPAPVVPNRTIRGGAGKKGQIMLSIKLDFQIIHIYQLPFPGDKLCSWFDMSDHFTRLAFWFQRRPFFPLLLEPVLPFGPIIFLASEIILSFSRSYFTCFWTSWLS